jgi:nicotinate phosphoribosyltransferase
MGMLGELYKPSLTLLTDLYQLTMAYAYWKSERQQREAVFHLFFRTPPFHGGFTLAAGLATALEWIERFRFDGDDLAYLATLSGNDGQPLFDPRFLESLGQMTLTCDVDAVPEGTVVFPNEPLVRVQGPLVQAQLLETALLNLINFQTLIATKAARVVAAAEGDAVLEFGLRRAQGIDGALSASRAAYIGGCASTSNVLAGRLFGIPVGGTHAHSWVMCFDDELEAFLAYARALPNNAVFLVDTYDTLAGVRHAIEAGQGLRAAGHKLAGIRLDSGDLAYLSVAARQLLDEAGFTETAILASNDLDEHLIASLKQQGAAISIWGVGTRLVTGHEQPALGGVYKLAAIRDADGQWQPKVKLSEQAIKSTTPGMLAARRYFVDGEPTGDMIYDLLAPPDDDPTIVDPLDQTRRKPLPDETQCEELLVPVMRGGRTVYVTPPLPETRRRAAEQLAMFHAGVKRFVNPHQYPVGLERGLFERKTQLILRARGFSK